MTETRTVQERLHDLRQFMIGEKKPISAATVSEALARIDALEGALNPSAWTKAMSDAWHQNIPDTQRAFYALYRAALHPQQEQK